MGEFRTKKGTVLPLLNLKGKEYLQVAHRIVWFREEHQFGRIESECVESNETYVIYKASISITIDGSLYIKIADAVKREDYSHFPDAHEKAQTGAIGRALALCGYGTQFAPEFDEGERIVDSPLDKKPWSKNPNATNEKPPSPFVKKEYGGILNGNHPLAMYPFPEKAKKFFGKNLGDIKTGELRAYAETQKQFYVKENKTMREPWVSLINNIQEYCDAVDPIKGAALDSLGDFPSWDGTTPGN